MYQQGDSCAVDAQPFDLTYTQPEALIKISVNNILSTSIQLQVYNSMINREKINRN